MVSLKQDEIQIQVAVLDCEVFFPHQNVYMHTVRLSAPIQIEL